MFDTDNIARQQAINGFDADTNEESDNQDEQTPIGVSTRDAHEIFPQIFGKRRNGETFVRKVKGSGMTLSPMHAFTIQDRVKNTYRDFEVAGLDARFAVELRDGSHIVFSKLFSDWFMQNSTLANIIRNNWKVSVTESVR